jgi:hypothetical protein
MWVQDRPLLELNMADELFHHELTCLGKAVNPINDVVFVSKHAAASGTASLTVHPIGISWETDTTRSGGIAGRCSPPSFRISSFYRSLLQEVKEFGIDKKYEVTLEVSTRKCIDICLPSSVILSRQLTMVRMLDYQHASLRSAAQKMSGK